MLFRNFVVLLVLVFWFSLGCLDLLVLLLRCGFRMVNSVSQRGWDGIVWFRICWVRVRW